MAAINIKDNQGKTKDGKGLGNKDNLKPFIKTKTINLDVLLGVLAFFAEEDSVDLVTDTQGFN